MGIQSITRYAVNMRARQPTRHTRACRLTLLNTSGGASPSAASDAWSRKERTERDREPPSISWSKPPSAPRSLCLVVDLNIARGPIASVRKSRFFTLIDTPPVRLSPTFARPSCRALPPRTQGRVYADYDPRRTFAGVSTRFGWGVLPGLRRTPRSCPRFQSRSTGAVAQLFPVRIRVSDPAPTCPDRGFLRRRGGAIGRL